MSPNESLGQAHGSGDPEAEQEVDLGRYWRLLAARWWLLAAGIVIGALIGYAFSLGSSQSFQATATLYLGQPYSPGGGVAIQTLQTNPSTVKTIIHSTSVIDTVAAACQTSASTFSGGISSQAIAASTTTTKSNQSPLVSVTVKAKLRKASACAATGLAKQVVGSISAYANQKIAYDRRQVSADEIAIDSIQKGLSSSATSSTDKLLLQIQLASRQEDLSGASQLLLLATQVESPKVLTPASPSRVTARSRRNSVVVAALIGLILGAIGALMWDGIAGGATRRRSA